MLSRRRIARKPLIPFLQHLPFPHLLTIPEQPDPEPTSRNDMQARCCRIRIDVVHPHASFPVPIIPPPPSLDHLLRLLDALLPYDGVAPLVESAAADFPVVAPRGTFGSDDVGAEMLDDGIMFNGLDPVGAAEGDLVDQGGGGVREIKTPRGDNEEGVAVDGKGAEAFLIGPYGIENTRMGLS